MMLIFIFCQFLDSWYGRCFVLNIIGVFIKKVNYFVGWGGGGCFVFRCL